MEKCETKKDEDQGDRRGEFGRDPPIQRLRAQRILVLEKTKLFQ
jgi:hypothetical protein